MLTSTLSNIETDRENILAVGVKIKIPLAEYEGNNWGIIS